MAILAGVIKAGAKPAGAIAIYRCMQAKTSVPLAAEQTETIE